MWTEKYAAGDSHYLDVSRRELIHAKIINKAFKTIWGEARFGFFQQSKLQIRRTGCDIVKNWMLELQYYQRKMHQLTSREPQSGSGAIIVSKWSLQVVESKKSILVCSTPPPGGVPCHNQLMPAGERSPLRDFAAPFTTNTICALYRLTIGGSAGGKHRSFRSDLDALRSAIQGIGFEDVAAQSQPLPSPPKEPALRSAGIGFEDVAAQSQPLPSPPKKPRTMTGQKRKSSPVAETTQDRLNIECNRAMLALRQFELPASQSAALEVHRVQQEDWASSEPGLLDFAALLETRAATLLKCAQAVRRAVAGCAQSPRHQQHGVGFEALSRKGHGTTASSLVGPHPRACTPLGPAGQESEQAGSREAYFARTARQLPGGSSAMQRGGSGLSSEVGQGVVPGLVGTVSTVSPATGQAAPPRSFAAQTAGTAAPRLSDARTPLRHGGVHGAAQFHADATAAMHATAARSFYQWQQQQQPQLPITLRQATTFGPTTGNRGSQQLPSIPQPGVDLRRKCFPSQGPTASPLGVHSGICSSLTMQRDGSRLEPVGDHGPGPGTGRTDTAPTQAGSLRQLPDTAMMRARDSKGLIPGDSRSLWSSSSGSDLYGTAGGPRHGASPLGQEVGMPHALFTLEHSGQTSSASVGVVQGEGGKLRKGETVGVWHQYPQRPAAIDAAAVDQHTAARPSIRVSPSAPARFNSQTTLGPISRGVGATREGLPSLEGLEGFPLLAMVLILLGLCATLRSEDIPMGPTQLPRFRSPIRHRTNCDWPQAPKGTAMS